MMTCPNCGNSIPDENGFCLYCGKPVSQSPPPQMQYAHPQSQYAPPQVQYTPPRNQYAPPPPNPPVRQTAENNDSQTVTMGEWFGYLVLMAIPVCNIIMLFIFAFNPKIKRSKANLARLQLLLMAIGVGIALTVIIILAAAGISLFDNLYRIYY